MKIIADTNVLIRAAVMDDAKQAAAVRRMFESASSISVSNVAFCEFVWVLREGLKHTRADIAAAIKTIIDSKQVAADRNAVEAGLAAMASGADFADGVIAFECAELGGEVFASFDRAACKKLSALGLKTLTPD